MTQMPNSRIRHACVREVQRYIRDHLDESLHPAVLATIVGFSVPHLHRVFAEAIGESISSYVRRVRLERAGLRLRAGAIDISPSDPTRVDAFQAELESFGVSSTVRVRRGIDIQAGCRQLKTEVLAHESKAK